MTEPNQECEKKVYTYYEAVSTIDADEQRQQIEVCRQSWQKHGWELVVIGEKQAKQHPWFELYSLGIRAVPTVNAAEYEYSCFLRWLAMAAIGGGLMIDYDVMNMGVTDLSFFQQHSLLTIYQGHVPCVVYGTAEQYLEVCRRFFLFAVNRMHIGTHRDRPHASDMVFLQSGFNQTHIKKLQVVAAYPNQAELIHCSNRSVKPFFESKLEAMQKLLLQLNT